DGTGALVLSEFTGAAHELHQAYLVNPHDLDMVGDTIVEALGADPAERKERMVALHEQVVENDVHRWAARFLDALKRSGD
ncbi:trehalose-6-phosphate synthase, partial [Rhodococcus sp. CX]|uniref:trehalose-6-phosphate synthase n=2 Tax=unclassified Rhodococcus (in: high G+C Gram-positive bacteria) TaxID=192944 RepID=UPI001E4ED677